MIKNSQTIGALSFAFRKTINEKWSRELLIQNVNLFSVTDEIVTIINPQGQPQITHGYRSQTSGLGLGLEAHRQIGNGDGKLNFRLGGMTSLNFSHQNFSPKISTSFPFRTSQFGVGLSVIPRVEYRINSRCNFSLSAFLPFMELGFNQTTSENPRIPKVQRRVSTTDLNLFENPTHFRFGLAYKLSPKEEE
jgi:hypothetical protein